MIVNGVFYLTNNQFEEKIKKLAGRKNAITVFIDGDRTPSIKETTEILFEALNINEKTFKNLFSKSISYDEAIEKWCKLFDKTPYKNLDEINIMIKNSDKHHQEWDDKKYPVSLSRKVITNYFYNYICKYYEHSVIAEVNGGKRKSFDVYLCASDCCFEDLKIKFNNK